MIAKTQKRKNSTEAARSVTILGSTGSIGLQTVDVLMRSRQDYDIVALTAHSRVDDLVKQALEVKPRLAVIGDEQYYSRLKEGLFGSGIESAAGEEALCEAALRQAEWIMVAIVGSTALRPVMAAVTQGGIVALANKESLVCAGQLVQQKANEHGTTIIPVDSEHSAIFQVFNHEQLHAIDKIILTASGGPFWRYDAHELKQVTPKQALAHPNWDMGAKISIDSATMMNKGLELIEACQLFPIAADDIDIVIHPQSILHSAVCYKDGSMLGHMGVPDMRTPICYALAWPKRMYSPVKTLSLADLGQMTFHHPNEKTFPFLALARECQKQGGTAPIVLNATNEVAVHAFLKNHIGFCDIFSLVETLVTKNSQSRMVTHLDDVLQCDREARQQAQQWLSMQQHAQASAGVP